MNKVVLIKGEPNNDRNIPFGHIIILLSAFFNAALRPDIDSDITLFRIIFPFIFLFIIYRGGFEARKLSITLLIFTVLQLISFSFSYYEFSPINFISYANYFIMFTFVFYTYIISEKFSRSSLDNLITLYIYALIIFSALQYLFDIQVFNVQERLALNSWYGNENDTSVTLTAFILYRCRFGLSWKDIPTILSSLLIISYNDSRGCLLTLSILPFYLAYKAYGVVFLSAFIAFLFISISTLFIITGYTDYIAGEIFEFLVSLRQGLLIIFELKVIPGISGSIDVRSVAATLAVIDFLDYPLFGTGVGNTYSLIEYNSVIFGGVISSIHNMPLMILTEMGIIGSIFIIYSLFSISKVPLGSYLFWLGIFSLASISSAGGFVVNYFVLMILIITICSPLKKTTLTKPQKVSSITIHAS